MVPRIIPYEFGLMFTPPPFLRMTAPREFPLAVAAKVAYLTAGCWETKGAARSLFPQQFTDR